MTHYIILIVATFTHYNFANFEIILYKYEFKTKTKSFNGYTQNYIIHNIKFYTEFNIYIIKSVSCFIVCKYVFT